MITIALEGPSCVGKTTALTKLIESLSSNEANFLYFPCYSDSLGNDGPRARPSTTQEQLDAFMAFMDVESARVASVRQASPPPDLVILDRSVDTLLAHCKAVDGATGSSSYPAAQRELAKLPHLIPDLTIYFDCPLEVIKIRAKQDRSSLDEFFLDSSFLEAFLAHFASQHDVAARSLEHIDAAQSKSVVASNVSNMIISTLEISMQRRLKNKAL